MLKHRLVERTLNLGYTLYSKCIQIVLMYQTDYKLNARKAIKDHVIMSIGDKTWDIGEGGGYGILVKNN